MNPEHLEHASEHKQEYDAHAPEVDYAPELSEDTSTPVKSDGDVSEEEFAGTGDEADADDAPHVAYEGDRPLVRELHYQQPRQKVGADETEPSEEGRFSSIAEARAVVEGFLFSSNEPLSVSRLGKLMSNLHPKTVRGLLLELQWEYENRGGALQVIEIAGGYQMCTRPFVAPWMFRLHKLKRRSPLSPATLETLAIIAYRQPITKGEIEAIRGVETGAPIRTLQELSLIESSGRREVPGRPQLYVTSEQFLKIFGLKSIGDLPSISELKNRFAEEQKLKPKIAEPQPDPAAEDPVETNAPEKNTADTEAAEPPIEDEEQADDTNQNTPAAEPPPETAIDLDSSDTPLEDEEVENEEQQNSLQ